MKGAAIIKNKKRDIRIVFLIWSAIIAIIGWKHYPSILSNSLFAVSGIILIVNIISPFTLEPLFNLWLKAAHFVGMVNTQIILALLFFLIFTPIGIVMRVLEKDPMKRRFSSDNTYWENYELEGLKDIKRYEKQF